MLKKLYDDDKNIINKKIDEYIGERFDNWHTPGHRGKLNKRDITEIEGFPESLISQAEKKVARFYGSRFIRFLTGGSSIGIKAAIMSVGGDILAAANSHRAVFEGAEIARVNVFKIENTYSDGLLLPLSEKQILEGLEKHNSVRAVVITSPDYYGQAANTQIAEAVRSRGLLLIADSAHGAHFPASDLFPASFSSLADVCNLSAHKTLKSYTQSAYLAINNEEMIKRIDHNLRLLGTTSPSYLLMGELEGAIDDMPSMQQYRKLFERISRFKAKVQCKSNDDFSRIVIAGGEKLYKRLIKRKIMPEMFDGENIVFIATVFDKKEKFERLANCIIEEDI